MSRDKKIGVHGTDAERETGFSEPPPGVPLKSPARGKGSPKTDFPFDTKAEFIEKAPPLVVKFGEGVGVTLAPSYFNPDKEGKRSVGYRESTAKITIMIDGKAVKFQLSMNVVAVNSKLADE